MERNSNSFRNEDENARIVLGCVQLFTFAVALMMLLVVSNI